MTKCIGWQCYVVACNEQNGNPAQINWRRVGELEGGHYPHTQPHHLSMGLAGISLGASTLHLGRPIYAWRALKELRRSWLSREVLSLFAEAAQAFAALLWLDLPFPRARRAGYDHLRNRRNRRSDQFRAYLPDPRPPGVAACSNPGRSATPAVQPPAGGPSRTSTTPAQTAYLGYAQGLAAMQQIYPNGKKMANLGIWKQCLSSNLLDGSSRFTAHGPTRASRSRS